MTLPAYLLIFLCLKSSFVSSSFSESKTNSCLKMFAFKILTKEIKYITCRGCIFNDKVGLAIATDFSNPRLFRISYNADADMFYIVFDIGLSSSTLNFPSQVIFFFEYLIICKKRLHFNSSFIQLILFGDSDLQLLDITIFIHLLLLEEFQVKKKEFGLMKLFYHK
jgi:hypothetical protein